MTFDAPSVDRLYRALIEAAPDAVLVVEAGGSHYVLVNAAAERLLGYGRDELYRMSSADILDPGELPRLPAVRREFLERGFWRGEWRLLRKDGSIVQVEVTNTRLEVGERVLYQGFFRDITERRQIEQALARREAQIATAQALARLGSWEWDIDEDVVLWSDEMFRIFGLDPRPEPLPLDEIIALIVPDDRERMRAFLEDGRRTGAGWDTLLTVRRPDGSERVLHSRAVVLHDASGRPVRLIGAAQDVTEQQRAERMLRRREEQLRSLLEHAPDGIAQFDRDLRLVYMNPAGERLRGRPAAEMLGQTAVEAGLSAARVPNWELCLRQAFRTGREVLVDVPIHTQDSEIRPHQVRLSPVFAADGSVESVMTVARDISEWVRAEEERARLYRELLERERRLHQAVEEILLDRDRRRERTVGTLHSLSEREREILHGIASGRTNLQIARELGLSNGTVRNHVSRLLRKLGVVDRTQAAIRALEWGMLEEDRRLSSP